MASSVSRLKHIKEETVMEEKNMYKNSRCPDEIDEEVDLEYLYADWWYITLDFSPDYFVE